MRQNNVLQVSAGKVVVENPNSGPVTLTLFNFVDAKFKSFLFCLMFVPIVSVAALNFVAKEERATVALLAIVLRLIQNNGYGFCFTL